MQSPELRYRVATDDDIPRLLSLLAHAGWGEIDEATWRSWYREAPSGPSLLMIGEAAGRVMAQLEFRPCSILVDGQRHRSVRMASLATDPDVRMGRIAGADHPGAQLLDAATDALRDQGVEFVYTLPHRALILLARLVPRAATKTFGCVGLAVAAVHDAPPVQMLDDECDAVAELWNRVGPPNSARVAVDRGVAHLMRQRGDCYRFAWYDAGGSMAAYAAVRRSDGLVTDIFGTDAAAMQAVLKGACAEFVRRGGASLPWSELHLLDSPYLAPALSGLSTVRVRYRFGFVVRSVGDGVTSAALDPDLWHLAGGD